MTKTDEETDMADVFAGTAEDDAAEVNQGEAAKDIKAAHALSREIHNRLATCRLATATHDAIRHDLDRVVELCEQLRDVTESARGHLLL